MSRMKTEVRTLAFDDAPFTRPDGRVPVVGVHMRGAHRIEGILLTDVARDGARRVPPGPARWRAPRVRAVARNGPRMGSLA